MGGCGRGGGGGGGEIRWEEKGRNFEGEEEDDRGGIKERRKPERETQRFPTCSLLSDIP